jgi:elongation factor P
LTTTNDLHNGMYFEYDGAILEVVEFQHVKPGKGPAFVRAKTRNMRTGAIVERTYRAGEKIEKVRMDKKIMEYLYQDGDHFVFMDVQNYDQVNIPAEVIGDRMKFIKPNSTISVLFNGQEIMGAELPQFLEFVIEYAEPGEKGNTVQGALKKARLETGAEMMVPLFIEAGNTIKIDTRTMRYIERVSK